MKRLYFVLVMLIINVLLFSQDLDYAKSVIQKLTSPELQGRGYTNNGNRLAAEFISGEFMKKGLLPLNKNYYQSFDVSVNTFPDEISLKINGESLKPAIDYLIESSSPGINGKFDIISIQRNDLNTQEKLLGLVTKAKNKFILIDNTQKLSGNKEQDKIIDDYISFLKYSSQISVAGILVYTKEKLTWDNSAIQTIRPIILVNNIPVLKNINTIELIIESRFIKKYETQNIVGYIKGSLEPDTFIVVTAHYDHLGIMGKETCFPGANDNASGVAMILNLAGYYSKHPPRYSMLFVALSAEELGLLGAQKFTEDPPISLQKIKFLVNFDLAGTGEEGIRVVNGSVYKDRFDLLTKINSENHLLPKIDIRGEACISDHCLFYKKGVPCFYIYTQGGIKAYHDIYDKYETLPLTAFVDYCTLMIKFFDAL